MFHAAKQEMYNHARSADDRAFMLYVSFTQPHNPFVAGRKNWDMYEGSMRVPLTAQGPKIKAGNQEPALASLVDLLLTFTDIASDGTFYEYAAPFDGRSLLKLQETDSEEDQIFIEFNGVGL